MAGVVSQSESDVIYQRLQNTAKQLLGIYEEIQRLQTLKTNLDLATNLDESSSGIVSKAEAVDYYDVLTDYEDFFENLTVTFDTSSGGNQRRAKIDPFLVTDNV